MKNPTNEKVLDIVIVGGGPAGLTAAIYAGRAGYKPLILEKEVPGGKMVKTGDIDNYPGYENIQGPDLSVDMYNQAMKHGAEFQYDGVVHFKKLDNGNFEIHTEGGKKYISKVLIIATGTLENKLGIPGEDKLYGKGVSYCAVCDGSFHKGEPIAVVGGGYSAVTEGMYLTKFAKPLMVFVRNKFKADANQVELLKKQPNVQFIMNTIVTEVIGEDKVEAIKTKNTVTGEEKTVKVGALFPYIGAKPVTQFVDDPSIKDKMNYLIPDGPKLETKIDGLFIAGDVRDVPLRQITTAVGDGSVAGQMAVEKLQSQGN